MQQLWNSYCWHPSVSLIAESGLVIWLRWYLVCLFCLTEECRVSFSVLAEDWWSAVHLSADGCRTLFFDGFSGSFCRGLNLFSSFIDYVPQLLLVLCRGVKECERLSLCSILLSCCVFVYRWREVFCSYFYFYLDQHLFWCTGSRIQNSRCLTPQTSQRLMSGPWLVRCPDLENVSSQFPEWNLSTSAFVFHPQHVTLWTSSQWVSCKGHFHTLILNLSNCFPQAFCICHSSSDRSNLSMCFIGSLTCCRSSEDKTTTRL